MRLLIMFFILAAGYFHACADTKTTRHNLKAARHATVSADASKLTPATDSLTISGYDKRCAPDRKPCLSQTTAVGKSAS